MLLVGYTDWLLQSYVTLSGCNSYLLHGLVVTVVCYIDWSRFHVTVQVLLTTEAQKYSRIRLKRCFMSNLRRILRCAFVIRAAPCI